MAIEEHSRCEPATAARDSEWHRESITAMARAPTLPNMVLATHTLRSCAFFTHKALDKTMPITNPLATCSRAHKGNIHSSASLLMVNSYSIFVNRRQGSDTWYTSLPKSLTPLESKTPLKAKNAPMSTKNATERFASAVARSTSPREDDEDDEDDIIIIFSSSSNILNHLLGFVVGGCYLGGGYRGVTREVAFVVRFWGFCA